MKRYLLPLGITVLATNASGFPSAPSCPITSGPTTFDLSTVTKNGTTFDTVGNNLQLQHVGDQFQAALTQASTESYVAAADFNKDGWIDYVATQDSVVNTPLQAYVNQTWQNENCTDTTCTSYSGPAPDWNNPATLITPKFTGVRDLHGGIAPSARYGLAAADFNGDGWPDVFEAVAPIGSGGQITALNMYLNQAANDGAGNPQFQAAYDAHTGFTITSVLGDMLAVATVAVAVDYNHDGRMDILLANGNQGGSIRILLNNCPGTLQANGVVLCSSNPQFTDGGYLISNLDTGNSGFGTNVTTGTPAFAYADVDGDGLPDLVVGAPNCCAEANYRLRLFKGCSGGVGCTAGLENVASQNMTYNGAATSVHIADFSGDGKPDLFVASDGHSYNAGLNGGASWYWINNGTTTPFSAAPVNVTAAGSPATDYDGGAAFDYDNDPAHRPDILVFDGNGSGAKYFIADGLTPQFVDCGDAQSGSIDLGSLADDEMVITAARLSPTAATNGGTIQYYLSNESPPNWVLASPCTVSPTTDYCAAFPKPVGRNVRWKAVMCSDTPNHTSAPTVSGITAKFDYTEASEHYRGGVVVNDGVLYVGAFQQPGDRGKLYAVNAALNTGYWEAGAKLDATADGSRNIYTTLANLPVRYDFTTTNASDPLLQGLLTTPDTPTTTTLINWVRSARFGIGISGIPLTKLGSIETSTPSILSKPGRPNYYVFASPIDRTNIDTFIANNANRVPLVLAGAKDGMIHAVYTLPTNISDPKNGVEAWAYIPPTVAQRMLSDYTATQLANTTATDGENHPTIAAYPDGSPTLADYNAGSGVYKTIAIVAEGNGGRSFTTLDVTQTVDPSSGTVNGPTPMWSATPGQGEAGLAFAKPALARVSINNTERYVVIAGTGIDFADTLGLKGRELAGYDLVTGTLLWKFQMKCPLTSDITAFETDDAGEPGTPTLNGFIDRAVFADQCGYVYKIAPGQDLGGNYMDNTGYGPILANTSPDGKPQYAIFSTTSTTGAIGSQRPIAGTIAARTDQTTRMVLFFGTGGVESFDESKQNAFFAVYADNGTVRSKFNGTCNGLGICEKFYGGTVVTPTQVIFTRTTDPQIGTGTCDPGSSTVTAFELNSDVSGNFVQDFALVVSSAVMTAMYGDAGAIYFATLSGDVARIGTPRAANAGDDTNNGVTQGMGVGDNANAGQTLGTTTPFTLMGWRVVL
jgi:hypothetical protein